MKSSVPFLVLSLWLMPGVAFAQDAPPPAPEDKANLLQQAAMVRGEADQLTQRQRETQDEIAKIRRELAQLKQTAAALTKKIEEQAAAGKTVEQELSKLQEMLKAGEVAKVKADQTAVDAKKALEEARKKVEETEKTAATAAKAVDDAKKATGETEKKLNDLKMLAATLTKEAEVARTSMDPLVAKLPSLETAVAAVGEQLSEKDRTFETLMRQAGEWVSFSGEIAPLFQARCVACHQTKSAKGQFNLETYLALKNGGESGPAVAPGDAEHSNLVTLLVDGSMPKDAEPLTGEQIALVRKWVDQGARLDAGVNARHPLIRVMPRPEHPTSPERYSVPVPITALALHHSGTLLATAGYHEILVWSFPEGKLVRRIGNLAERVFDLTFQPGGDLLAAATGTPGELGELKVFNVQDGALHHDLFITTDAMLTARFSPDGSRLAAAGANQTVSVFSVADGAETLTIQDHSDWIQGIAWSPDGKRLATASRDKAVKVFDAQNGAQLVSFSGHTEPASDVAFLGDGSTLVSSGKDQRLRIWKAADGTEIRALTGFGDDVPRFAIAANETVVTASLDRRARLHQLSDGKSLKTCEGSPVPLFSLALSPDGTLAIAGGADGRIRIWNLESAKLEHDWAAVPPEPAAPPAEPAVSP